MNYPITIDPTIFAACIFAFGLVFGSFLNVCIYRIPIGKSVVFPRSACPNCGAMIRSYDNVPVFGWIFLGGKCRNCKAPISARYVAVELLTAVLFVVCWLHAGGLPEALKLCVFSFLVIGLVFIDAEYHLLPNRLTFPGLLIGLLFSLFVPVQGLGMLDYRLVAAHVPMRAIWMLNSFLGAGIGALIIFAAGEIYFRVRGAAGMGFGDVKFMAMVGAFLGMKLTVFTILGASILGALFGLAIVFFVWQKRVRRRMRGLAARGNPYRRAWRSAQLMLRAYELPFGVFLGSVALASVFAGNALIHWYMGLY